MSDSLRDSNSDYLSATPSGGNRMSVPEIARRLNIGRLAVYALLEQGIIPGIRLGRRWIITRHAYERWERSCGAESGTRLEIAAPTEVTVC